MKLSKHVKKNSGHLFSHAGRQGKTGISPELRLAEVERMMEVMGGASWVEQ